MAKRIIIILLLFASVWWAGKGIFKYSVFSTHDLDHHLARAFDAVQTIKEGQFPLRWAGSLNYFCGVPIYNFFYPLIYYLIILINFFSQDITIALKIINFASLLVGTLFFYFWMKVETKKNTPAIGGALLYLYAPYRFSLIFVRGSPEYLAYAILPVVLYFYALFFESSGKKSVLYAFLASFTGALLAISHNFTVMFLFLIILCYLVVKSILLKVDLKKTAWTIFTFIGSFGMSAFFIGPALMEKQFTRIGENFLFWKEHFPTLGQLIRSPWGYFYSSLGTHNDGMSFMLGYAHWLVLGLATLFIILRLFKRKFDIWVILTFLASLLTIYLILPWSIPLWEKVKPLQEIQFSWRLLGVAIFTISALFSFILDKISSKYLLLLIFTGVVLLGFYGNRNHLLPQPISVQDLYRYADFEKLHYHRYSTTTLGDDIIAKGAGQACWFDVPIIKAEKDVIEYSIVEKGNTYGFVKFNIPKNPKSKIITMGLGYFPKAYKFDVNGKNILYDKCDGKVCFDISNTREGGNYISWKVVQTPIQSFFNKVSLAFFIIWILLLIGIKKIKPHILLIIILALSIFFRSYNLPGRIGFGWDQERDANAAVGILSGDFTLLGPRVQGPSGFFLPPYFFYLLAPFYSISSLSPYATTVFITFWAIVTCLIGYFVISRVFNKTITPYFLALWAVNPLAVSIDTIAWNPVIIPILFLLLIYLIQMRYLFLSGIVFGLGISFHLQFLFILPIFIPLIYDIVRSGKFKDLVYLLVGSLLPFLPILLFDLRHNFLNLKQIIEFVNGSDMGINRVMVVWERASSFMVGGSPSRVLGATIYLAVLIGLFSWGKKLLGISLVWAFSLPLFYLLVKNPSEYYFNYLLVPFILFLSILFGSWKKFGVLVLVTIAIYFGSQASPLLRNVNLSLREKTYSVQVLDKITKDTEPFNVSFDVPLNEDTGFRYLLKFYKVPASGDFRDPLIEFVIPSRIKKDTFSVGPIGFSFPSPWINRNWIR